MSTQKSIEEIGKSVHLILNNTLDRKLTRAEYSKVVEGVQAMLQSERDRAEEEREKTKIILKGICDMCDPNTPYHEDIWRVAYRELDALTNPQDNQ